MSTKGMHWERLDSRGEGNVSKRPEVRKKLSAAAKRRWNDPVAKAALLAAIFKSALKHSLAIKKSWKDPVMRARRMAGLLKALNSPEYKALQSQIRSARLQDPEVMAAWLKQVKKGLKASQTPEVMARRLAQLAAIKKTPEWKAAHRAGVVRATAEGKYDYLPSVGGTGKKEHFYSKKNQTTIFCESSWESIRVRTLERDLAVVSYSKVPARIPYVLDGKTYHYLPDFLIQYLDGRRVLEELKAVCTNKGYEGLFVEEARYGLGKKLAAKFRAARKFCRETGFQYRILTSVQQLRVV